MTKEQLLEAAMDCGLGEGREHSAKLLILLEALLEYVLENDNTVKKE